MEFPSTSEEGEGKGKGTVVPSNSEAEEEEDEDYSEQQYPLADDKYKNLEERLEAMEIQRVPGLDFEELGLVSGIVIPPNLKYLCLLSTMDCLARRCTYDPMLGKFNHILLAKTCGSTFSRTVCRGHSWIGSTS